MATTQEDYTTSVARVLQYIDEHLDRDLSMERMADLALFSKYHFHRIFKAAVGETLATHVARRRLERAVFLFKHSPELSVTEVALKAGFNSPEHFSRCFRERFQITAREFRAEEASDPNSAKNRRIYQELSDASFYHLYEESREMPAAEFSVQIKEVPSMHVAYISETFGQDGTKLVTAWNDLMDWSESIGIDIRKNARMGISRDDIEVTAAADYRLDFCIEVSAETKPSGRVALRELPGQTYAVIPVRGSIHLVAQAWDHLYKFWLPRSGYRPIDAPAVEFFNKGPEQIGWETFDLLAAVPVKRNGRTR